MKNILLLFIAFFWFQPLGLAQEAPAKFRLELSVQSVSTLSSGIKIAQEDFFYHVGKSFKYSTQISGFWRLNDRWEAGLGVAYTLRDANTVCYCINCDKLTPANGFFTRIRSLDLPVELRLKWLKSPKRFDPYASFGLRTRMPFNLRGGPQYDQTRLNVKGTFLGLNLGLGTRIHLFEKWTAIVGLSVEKNSRLNYSENRFFQEKSFLGLNEWSVKIGVGRSF